MNWYKTSKKWKEHLPGGKADGKTPNDFNKKDLEIGKNVEFEHTNNPDIAKEISMDHLEEHPDYYQGLHNMENMLSEIEKKRHIRKEEN